MNLRLRTTALLAATLLAAGCAGVKTGSDAATPATTSATTNAATSAPGAATLAVAEAQRAGLANAVVDSGASVLRMPDGQLQINVPSDFSFGSDHAEIRAEGRRVLDNLATALKAPEYRAMRVRVVGFTDSVGGEAANDVLSLSRATSVRNFLASRGVAADRLEAEGRGERDPIAPNDKDYGRALNRRIEIYLREP